MIHSVHVSFGKWIEGRTEVPAGERTWRAPNLPERRELVAALENIVFSVEPPFLVSPCRVEIVTHVAVRTLEVDKWESEEDLAGTIVAWVAAASLEG